MALLPPGTGARAIWSLHEPLGWSYDTRFALALFGVNLAFIVPLVWILDRGRLIGGAAEPGNA